MKLHPSALLLGTRLHHPSKKPRLKGKSRCDRIHLAKEGYLKIQGINESKNG